MWSDMPSTEIMKRLGAKSELLVSFYFMVL